MSPAVPGTGIDREALRQLGLLLLACALVVGAGLGLRQPWPADEPRFVLVAMQMWNSGDWLFQQRGSELYADKPPLYFWLLCAAYALTRSWTLAFLVPSLLAALASVGLTWDLARRLWGPRVALYAGAALLFAAQFAWQAKRAQIDPTLLGLTTLSLYGLLRHLLTGPAWRWYLAGCVAAGLGVLAKGVGALPLLVLALYAGFWRQGWQGLAPRSPGAGRRLGLGLLAALAPIALWLAALVGSAWLSGDPARWAYVDELLFRQTAQRYVDPWHHHQPWWYFAEVVAVAWLPLSLALPWLVPRFADAWRRRDARVWLPLAWALLVLVLFSLSPGKRDVYLMPALPALALAAAPFLPGLLARRGPRWTLAGFMLVLALLLFGASLAALYGEPGFATRFDADRGLAAGDQRHWLVLAAIGGSMLVVLLATRVRHALAGAALALALLWTGYGLGLAPLLDAGNSGRALMQRARDAAGPGVTLGLVGWSEQYLLQAVGPVTEFGYRPPPEVQLQRGLAWLHAAPGQRRLMLQREHLPACADSAAVIDLGRSNRRSFVLAGADALVPGCGD